MRKGFCHLGLWLSACLASFVFSSCGKCSGCDMIYVTEGGALDIPDTSRLISRPDEGTTIAVEKIVNKKDGDRHCSYKDVVACEEDDLDSANIVITCNKNLKLEQGEITAGENLWHVGDLRLRDQFNFPYLYLRTASDFEPGRYTFRLSGYTKNGKALEDIGFVVWQ